MQFKNRRFINKFGRIAAGLIIAAGVGGYNYLTKDNTSSGNQNGAKVATGNSPAIDNPSQLHKKIRAAKEDYNSRFWMTADATVIKNLKDDKKGSQHQKFLVELAPDITLLVAHNIDLAPRAPVVKGDKIKIKGRYEWNNRGGVVHWTHHDPKGKKEGGWIYADNRYFK